MVGRLGASRRPSEARSAAKLGARSEAAKPRLKQKEKITTEKAWQISQNAFLSFFSFFLFSQLRKKHPKQKIKQNSSSPRKNGEASI